jgi:heat shock protein HslJ
MTNPGSLARLVLLAAIAFAGVACDFGVPRDIEGGSVPTLAGTSWSVATVNGRPPISGAEPTLAFDSGNVRGFGGCNHIGGRYQLDVATGRFVVLELGGTAMGCVQAGVLDSETAFMTALGRANQASIDPAGQLVLTGPGTQIVLVSVGATVID